MSTDPSPPQMLPQGPLARGEDPVLLRLGSARYQARVLLACFQHRQVEDEGKGEGQKDVPSSSRGARRLGCSRQSSLRMETGTGLVAELLSTTVALFYPAVIAVVGSDIAGLVPDGVCSIETRTGQAQRGDSPSIRAG